VGQRRTASASVYSGRAGAWRAALPVGVDGLFFQQAAAVGQQDLAQVVSGFAAQDLAPEPFLTSSGR
jgi:hypothetical protein